jgi:hypothetical protein
MSEGNPIKKAGKIDPKLRKLNMYKDAAKNAMDNNTAFDSKIIDANNEYLNKLCQADQAEYDILLENLKLATSEEERAEIRARMTEMKKERYQKDTENKKYYEKQQENHKNFNYKVLGSLLVISGLVWKYKKPIIDTTKNFITKV